MNEPRNTRLNAATSTARRRRVIGLLVLAAAVAAHLLMLLDEAGHPHAAHHPSTVEVTQAEAHAGGSGGAHGTHHGDEVAHLMAASCLVALLAAPAARGLRHVAGRVCETPTPPLASTTSFTPLIGPAGRPDSPVAQRVLLRI